MRIAFGFIIAALYCIPAAAQQNCPATPDVGTSNTTCANTAFVTRSVARTSYLSGLTLSNDVTSPNTVIDISAGSTSDSTHVFTIVIGAFTKSTAGAWVAGSGHNGMGNGLTVTANTWYHVFAIVNNGTPDIYFDTSVTAANAPTGTTAFRRIGSFAADGSANIVAFSQHGDEFLFTQQRTDVAAATPPTTRTLVTLGVPLGVKTNALFVALLVSGTAGIFMSFASPDQSGTISGFGGGNLAYNIVIFDGASPNSGTQRTSTQNIRTNTNSQIVVLASAGAPATYYIQSLGYIDRRGGDD